MPVTEKKPPPRSLAPAAGPMVAAVVRGRGAPSRIEPGAPTRGLDGEARAPCGHASARPTSLLYQLERFDVGVVSLDAERRVVGMNAFARQVLPVQDGEIFDQHVLAFHPERSRGKVRWLIDTAECPVSNPPPMTMVINIPERVLLIKVCKIADRAMRVQGFTLVFHDITDSVAAPVSLVEAGAQDAKRQLGKIPTLKHNRIELVDVDHVVYVRSDGHYTHVQTVDGMHFCNLSISDLQDRLDAQAFVRTHRSYLVNLRHVSQLIRGQGRVQLAMSDAARSEVPVGRSHVAGLMTALGVK